jgi:hypothetical protein
VSVVSVIGIAREGRRARHYIPAVVFGVWCAHPGVGELWRVSHGPTGKALFCGGADVDWWTAIRAAEEFHREFGDRMPTGVEAKRVLAGVIELADAFIRSMDWLK